MCYISSRHDILLQDPYQMGYFAELEPEFAPEMEVEALQRLIDSYSHELPY